MRWKKWIRSRSSPRTTTSQHRSLRSLALITLRRELLPSFPPSLSDPIDIITYLLPDASPLFLSFVNPFKPFPALLLILLPFLFFPSFATHPLPIQPCPVLTLPSILFHTLTAIYSPLFLSFGPQHIFYRRHPFPP
jgi:hypothetical protein